MKEPFAGSFDFEEIGSHPHIIRLHDFVISDRNFFICMECAPKTCVDTLVDLHLDENSEFQLSESSIASFFAQLLKALAHLHTFNVAHLDLKPDNLLVAASMERFACVILGLQRVFRVIELRILF